MSQKYFITTPIYYSNGIPHIGHAYASFIADILGNFARFQGKGVRLVTGVDENSQKIVEAAAANNMTVGDYTDKMAEKHQSTWDGIGINYTHFVRTTSTKHAAFVQKMLQKSYDAGDIYLGEYEGLYCVGCEGFKTEKDLILDENGNMVCADHPNKTIEHIKEKNYFFRLSRYESQLLEFYESHPDWISPRTRYNEIIEFVKGGLQDFSISRETNTFGIPLPFDKSQVTYVWYDALFSYISAGGDGESWWPADVHVLAKDIVKFHAIYWPAMLWSVGFSLPKKLVVTGYFTVDGQKMSKTLGNVIDPVEYTKTYSRDMLLLYLLSVLPIGEDGDFDRKQVIVLFNAKLANNIGNLLNRLITLSLKVGGSVQVQENNKEINGVGFTEYQEYLNCMNTNNLKGALDISFEYASAINKFIDNETPWKINIEDENGKKQLMAVLYEALYHLRKVAIMLLPFFAEKMQELLIRIGTEWKDSNFEQVLFSTEDQQFTIKEKGEPLYLRLPIE